MPSSNDLSDIYDYKEQHPFVLYFNFCLQTVTCRCSTTQLNSRVYKDVLVMMRNTFLCVEMMVGRTSVLAMRDVQRKMER